jgi:hypothetical protein
MALKENPFRQWMDENRLSSADLAGPMGVSIQTIHNWRSAGVPTRRQPYVKDTMTRWHVISGRPMNSIVVVAGEKQFEQWSEAALAAGKTLVKWATDGLDEMATKHFKGQSGKALTRQAEISSKNIRTQGTNAAY